MLSVLIVNWNTRDLLRKCLLSLLDHPCSEGQEIVVVDNASSDGSEEMVQNEFPSVNLIQSGKNLGYAAGNNLAFANATGEHLLTLNADTEIFTDTLDTAVEVLESRPKVGCVGAKLIGVDGKPQSSVRGFPTIMGIFGDVSGLGRKTKSHILDSYRLSAFDYELEQEAPQPMGTFLMFKREALEAIGDPKAPFDEAFPIFFNEVDLLLRLSRAGWKTIYSPRVSLLHYGGESTKQVRKSMIWESHRSLVRFLRKHAKGPLEAGAIGGLSVVILLSAFIRAKGYDRGFRL